MTEQIKKPFYKAKWFKVVLIIVIILGLIAFGVSYMLSRMAKQVAGLTTEMTAPVERGNVEVTITGSGTVEPYERYEIIPMVQGSILRCDYEEGDYVEEDAVLYEIESDEAQNALDRIDNSIEEANLNNKTNYENLQKTVVYAEASGVISDFTLKTGDTVGGAGQSVGKITDQSQLIATVAVNQQQYNQISIGDSASVVVEQYMMSIDGLVTKKAGSSNATSDGAMLYDIEITVDNPGAVPSGTTVSAVIHSVTGDVEAPSTGVIAFSDSVDIKTRLGGEVKTVYVEDGQTVQKGDRIYEIDDSDIQDSISKAKIGMQNTYSQRKDQEKKLEDYRITSPISGTVITKNYKAGDTIGTGTDSKSLMVVADMSKMKFTFNTDELDIAKVEVGQRVQVTADAIENVSFEGIVTNIAAEGTAANGVTTYPVEVTIEEPGNLKPGMNVNAEIIYESAEDVLRLPLSGVRQERGAEPYVYVKDPSAPQSDDPSVPSGAKKVEVEIGLSNETYIEIVSGLEEGQEVILNQVSSMGSDMMAMPMGGEGMMIQAAPAGGMGGPGGPGGRMGGM